MRNLCWFLLLLFLVAGGFAQSNSYLFVWAGDDAKKSSDFLAVLDADAKSPRYGQAVASVAVPGPSGTPHHTELEMPEGSFLLANAFESGRTMLFDLRDPLHPSLVTAFGDLDGYMHPHTYVRLANGHVLATFQYHGGHDPKSDGGGLVEFDEHGHLIRSSSAMDAAGKGELIRPYSLVVVPALDRVVSTNTSMHRKDDGVTRTVQVWRLSDLKLLRTIVLPTGPLGSENLLPGEPRLMADGKTVLVHTFRCGLYEMEGIDTERPSVRHLKTFDGKICAVPLRIGHYWIQTLFSAPALAAYDISDLAHVREVSRVTFDDGQKPHWIAADADGRRIVLNSGEYGDHRLFIVNFDPQTGALKLDEQFRDSGSDKPGVSMDGKSWPHGFHGDAYPHGTVFSLPAAAVKSAATTDIMGLYRRYTEAAIHFDIATLRAMTADDAVWTLFGQTLVGKEQVLGPNEFDAGMQTELEYSNAVVKGNAVEFELTERNCVLRALGTKELHHYVRFVFENSLVKRKELRKDSPTAKQLAPRQMELLVKWAREKHPDDFAKLSDSKGNTIYSRETGALTCKLVNEWAASKALD